MNGFDQNFVFPAPRSAVSQSEIGNCAYEDVQFTSEDGTLLNGWYFCRPQSRACVLYCHGNAECLSLIRGLLKNLSERLQISLFAFDYRGYGRSHGEPSEEGLMSDARAASRWFSNRENISKCQLTLMGRSLGGAVAVQLAASHGARALILDSTFSSLPDIVQHHFPNQELPTAVRFDSINRISVYTGPLLQMHGDADEIIPIELGRKVFEASRSQHKHFISLVNHYHNSERPPEWYATMLDFISDPERFMYPAARTPSVVDRT